MNRFASIANHHNGRYTVVVKERAPEGHFTVISHAPFTAPPMFNRMSDAIAHADTFYPDRIENEDGDEIIEPRNR